LPLPASDAPLLRLEIPLLGEFVLDGFEVVDAVRHLDLGRDGLQIVALLPDPSSGTA
jgi:hypothetical protein